MNDDDRKSDLLKGKTKSGVTIWAPQDVVKGYLNPDQIKKRKATEASIQHENRATDCWVAECTRKPTAWVRELVYDIAQPGQAISTASVSTADYTGPIPGFCPGHLVSGPQELLKLVYLDRPEMQWGFYPERGVVIFHDGITQEFESFKFAANREVTVTDEHLKGNTNGNTQDAHNKV